MHAPATNVTCLTPAPTVRAFAVVPHAPARSGLFAYALRQNQGRDRPYVTSFNVPSENLNLLG